MHSYMSMSLGASGSAPPLPRHTVPREAADEGGEHDVHNAVKVLSHPMVSVLQNKEQGTHQRSDRRAPVRACSSNPQCICSFIYLLYLVT
jgi:hypothetical protein